MIAQKVNRLYPVDSFPPILKEVIIELMSNVQASAELIGTCVLSGASAAVQRHLKVLLPIGGQPKPVSLFVLVIAGSGDRKTTIDNMVFQPFREYDDQQQEKYERAMKRYRCEHRVWAAEERRLVRLVTGGEDE